MRATILVAGFALMLTAEASAHDWKNIPHFKQAFIDTSTIHEIAFDLPTGPSLSVVKNAAVYKVAWLRVDGVDLETVFDCHGKWGTMQQVVPDGSPLAKRYQSFDNTRAFQSMIGVEYQLHDIAPDSYADAAEPIACGPMSRNEK